MNVRTTGRLIAVFSLACVMMAARAQAASVTFTFNCTIVNATTCTPGGPLGTLKLTDSIVDPNRVDMDLTILPHAGVHDVADFFLNYNSAISLTGKSFRMVAQSAAPNTFIINGTDSVSLNTAGPLSTTLDMTLGPNSSFLLTYSGSLVLRLNTAPQTESDLSVDMFNLRDSHNLLYAAFNTAPAGTSLNAGATTSATAGGGPGPVVPETGALTLVGIGLVVIGAWGRKRLMKERER